MTVRCRPTPYGRDHRTTGPHRIHFVSAGCLPRHEAGERNHRHLDDAGPPYVKLGRLVKYHRLDLDEFVEQHLVA